MKKLSKEEKTLETSNNNVLKLNFSTGDVPSLDPHELGLGGRGVLLGKWLFEGLTRLNLKGNHELAGAERVDISKNQTHYTFTLRPNCYSDGKPVEAFDYERCLKKILAPNSKCPKAHLLYCIKNAEKAKQGKISLDSVGIKALDSKTLLIELNHPTSYLLGLLSMPLFAPFKVDKSDILGSGPYQLDKWKRDDFLSLSRNPFFWDKDNIRIHHVKISTIQNETTVFSLYEKGDLDWIGDPISFLPADILSSETAKGRILKGTGSAYPFWIHLNTQQAPLSSPFIRRALSCVINRTELTQYIFPGDDPLFTPLPSCLSLCKDHLIDNDLSKGKELFEEGMKELGLTRETFPPIELSACSSDKHRKLVECLKERWENAFGIQVTLHIQDWPAFYHDLQTGNFQVGGGFFGGDYYDQLAYLELLSCKTNFSKWHHPEYRDILERAKRETNLTTRLELLKEAESIVMSETPIIWVLNRVQQYAHRPDLKGLCFDHRGAFDLRWAYFEDKKSESRHSHPDR